MKKKQNLLIAGVLTAVLFGCTLKKPVSDPKATVDGVSSFSVAPFGTMKDGHTVTQYTLQNRRGTSMSVINYGGIITSLSVPDKSGTFEDVVLGFDSLSQYEKDSPYFGALVGRYGNRIAAGKFKINGKTVTLATNDGANHLHGGRTGFDKVYWKIGIAHVAPDPALKLTYTSADGEEGYPGTLSLEVIYTLTEDDQLKIDYTATTDKETVLNLTQHTYFNLSGNTKRNILHHELRLTADRFLPVNKGLIPTGELKPVDGTPFDFRKPTAIGARINNNDPQLKAGIGYDHCWIFADTSAAMKTGGDLTDPVSGRRMEFLTSEPAVQFYSGNFLNGKLTGKYGVVYAQRYGLCLETEHYPDSPNHPGFPSVILRPGHPFTSHTVYRFSTR